MAKIDKFEHMEDWCFWVGCKIEKHSLKPFKCGAKQVTVAEFGKNPYSGKDAFRIEEDDTWVDCYQCKKI